MFNKTGIGFIVSIIFLCLHFGFFGCSTTNEQINLTGHWTGRTENFSTNKNWEFKLYFFQNGNQLTGVYSDHHGNLSLLDAVVTGSELNFSIEVYPDTVTFTGDVTSENRLDGNWVYSANSNEGIWYLLRDDDQFSEDDEPATDNGDESNSSYSGAENPFR